MLLKYEWAYHCLTILLCVNMLLHMFFQWQPVPCVFHSEPPWYPWRKEKHEILAFVLKKKKERRHEILRMNCLMFSQAFWDSISISIYELKTKTYLTIQLKILYFRYSQGLDYKFRIFLTPSLKLKKYLFWVYSIWS